jgi:hypothetical protein
MEKPHYSIVIATPGSEMKSAYVKSLVETTKWLNKKGISYHFVSQTSSFVPSARENTATDSFGADWKAVDFGAESFTCEKVVWIDSDISWKVEDFEMLISGSRDIVAGMYAVGRDGRIAAMRLNAAGHPESLNAMEFLVEGEPVRVDGVGFGFVAVKAEVFRKMSRPWFKVREIGIEGADFPVMLGEDYSWCMGAKEAGYDIWLHPLIRVEHHKEVIFTV